MDLRDRVAIVTGGGSGLGPVLATGLAVLALVTDDSSSGTVVTLVGGEPPR